VIVYVLLSFSYDVEGNEKVALQQSQFTTTPTTITDDSLSPILLPPPPSGSVM